MDGHHSVWRIVAVWIVLMGVGSGCTPSVTTPTGTAIEDVAPATGSPAVTATGMPTDEPVATATATAIQAPTAGATAAAAQPTATIAPTEVPEEAARYLLTFEATWSAETHPTEFPPNPHFSGLIGATHGGSVGLWEEGEAATPGIKNMAETGGKSPLDREIETLIAEGGACATISGGGIGVSPGAVAVEFTATLECPLVTVVSMIAPSPDWFVGVSGLSLLGDEGWVEERVVELVPYDAGTDSGLSYRSPNDPKEEPEGIFEIEGGPLVVGDEVPSLGRFWFARLDG